MFHTKVLLGAVAALGVALSASAASIGIDFDDGGTNAGAATAGLEAQGNWNIGVSTDGDGAMTDMVDDAGAATTADVTWESANTWGGAAGPSGDTAMMNGWLDDGGTGALVTVTQIPYAVYDVIVYGTSDTGNGGRAWHAVVNGTDYNGDGVFVDPVTDGTYFVGTYVDELSGADNPNYVRVNGLSGDLTVAGLRATPSATCIILGRIRTP